MNQHFIDAHCHIADPRFTETWSQVLKYSRQKQISYFLMAGVGPVDWQRQLELKQMDSGLIPCFGLHPYWIAEHTEEECELALNTLAPLLNQSCGIGELGFDGRPHILKDSESRQLQFFEDQLQMAHMFQKPMVLHLVQCHELALRTLDVWGVPKSGGFVHAFNGSIEKAMDFIRRGLLVSVGSAICYEKNSKLRNAIKELPLEYLLIESDSPDQALPENKGEINEPSSIWQVAKKIALIRELTAEEVLAISRSNLMRLFQWSSLDAINK